MNPTYCIDPFNRKRLPTLEIRIGDLHLGGNQPIRLQSMTTTDTMDAEGSVAQSIRMIEAGCELVRLTAPSKNEAENLGVIHAKLAALGYHVPLVADIHFTPNAAEIAAKLIEKVRVNPGNYADKKKFEEIDYTDESYSAELERIEAGHHIERGGLLACDGLGADFLVPHVRGGRLERVQLRHAAADVLRLLGALLS